eukprot:CAMPEP_0181473572 /NCGR_PEP_ID=MMETSP1110-20121109/40192_1 /TAXON_ID=174948 /ORGANISM="Symbiodinium sp., Strain CCMP421" /LENGTH=136 /DNA_ID=CAMNT_0023598691 /DNA_START=81 /DNA_END=492 /DNA_ORIENTATION=+
MSLLVATAAVMSQASADNFLQPRQLQAPEVDVDCHEITYAQCVGNLFQQSDAMKECCQGKVEKSWVEVRDGMPWWGWPLLALGLVVLCACCVAASPSWALSCAAGSFAALAAACVDAASEDRVHEFEMTNSDSNAV